MQSRGLLPDPLLAIVSPLASVAAAIARPTARRIRDKRASLFKSEKRTQQARQRDREVGLCAISPQQEFRVNHGSGLDFNLLLDVLRTTSAL